MDVCADFLRAAAWRSFSKQGLGVREEVGVLRPWGDLRPAAACVLLEFLLLPSGGLPRGIFLGFDGGGFAAAVVGGGGWLHSAVGSGSIGFLLCEVCARTSRYPSAAERAVSAHRLPRELGGGFFRTLAITLAAWEALEGLLVRVWASLAPAIVSPFSAAEAPLLRGIAAPEGRVVLEALPRGFGAGSLGSGRSTGRFAPLRAGEP